MGGSDLYRIEFNNGVWGESEHLGPEINSKFDELFPFVCEDGNLYYSSSDTTGFGGLDIYMAEANEGGFTKGELLQAPLIQNTMTLLL